MQASTSSAGRRFGALAALLGALAVALGAFGAHAMHGHFDEAALQTWHSAVEYQFWYALALLLTASRMRIDRYANFAAWLFAGGIVLFCGSLYALALGAPHIVGAITPSGGIAFIAAWLLLAFGIWRSGEF